MLNPDFPGVIRKSVHTKGPGGRPKGSLRTRLNPEDPVRSTCASRAVNTVTTLAEPADTVHSWQGKRCHTWSGSNTPALRLG